MGEAVEALVEFDYIAKEPDELTIHKGDIITNIKRMDGGWWEGSMNGKKGLFPDNFVKVIQANARKDSTASKSRWCRVLFNYKPVNEDELELKESDLIEIVGEVEEGWWRGKLNNKVGVFPSNFVKEETVVENSPKEVSRNLNNTGLEQCKVLFAYNAVNEDELTLNVGDIVTVLSRHTHEKGWWKGELAGKSGVFPDNFVEIIDVVDAKKPQNHTTKIQINENTAQKVNKVQESAKHDTIKEEKSPPAVASKPIPAKKSTPPCTKAKSTESRVSTEFDSVGRADLLTQPVRVKAPRRRPPSAVLKEVQDNSLVNGKEESPKMVIPKKENENQAAKLSWVEELRKTQAEHRKSLEAQQAAEKKLAAPATVPTKPSVARLKPTLSQHVDAPVSNFPKLSPTNPRNSDIGFLIDTPPPKPLPSMKKAENKSSFDTSSKCSCPLLEERVRVLETQVQQMQAMMKQVTQRLEDNLKQEQQKRMSLESELERLKVSQI